MFRITPFLLLATLACAHVQNPSHSSTSSSHRDDQPEHKKCSTRKTFLYNMMVQQPKLCKKTERVRVECAGATACEHEVNVLTICENRGRKLVHCRDAGICGDDAVVLLKECSGQDCMDTYSCENGEIVYDEGTCIPCNTSTTARIKQGENRSKLSESIRQLSFTGDAFRDVRCFAADYGDTECASVSAVCSMHAADFDSVKCVTRVCEKCQEIADGNEEEEEVGSSGKKYCAYLLEDVCEKIEWSGIRLRTQVRPLARSTKSSHSACIDGCLRRPLGCGHRQNVCQFGEICEVETMRRYACAKKVRIACEGGGARCEAAIEQTTTCGTEAVVLRGSGRVVECLE